MRADSPFTVTEERFASETLKLKLVVSTPIPSTNAWLSPAASTAVSEKTGASLSIPNELTSIAFVLAPSAILFKYTDLRLLLY